MNGTSPPPAVKLDLDSLYVALNHMKLGVLVLTDNETDVDLSETARTILRLPPDTRVTLDDVLAQVHPDDRASLRRNFCRFTGNRVASVQEVRPLGGDATQWISMRFAELATTDTPQLVCLLEEVRHCRSENDELELTRTELSRSVISQRDHDEEQHNAMAREIHDDVGQTLTALRNGISMLAREPRNLMAHVGDLLRLVDESLESVRRIVLSLRTPVLDDLGLIAALRINLRQQCGSAGVHWSVEDGGVDSGSLNTDVRKALFRIGQEAVTNSLRHAQPGRIDLRFSRTGDGALEFTVTDDGVGLGDHYTENLGFLGMRERARALGTSLNIDTSPTGGTCLSVIVPHAVAFTTE